MRRVFSMVAGLAVAIPAAVLTLVAALCVVFALHGSGSSLPFLLLGLVRTLFWSDHPDEFIGLMLGAAAQGVAIVCCAPVICAALIGELARLHRPVWYALTAALLAVLLPLATGGGGAASFASPLAIGPLMAAGAVAGLCYGAIAAPIRPARPSPAPGSLPGAADPLAPV